MIFRGKALRAFIPSSYLGCWSGALWAPSHVSRVLRSKGGCGGPGNSVDYGLAVLLKAFLFHFGSLLMIFLHLAWCHGQGNP